jgi:hypothetical protein
MYDKWLSDYNSGFEEAMRKNGESMREESESHVGMEKLKNNRRERQNRSTSAESKKKDQSGNKDNDDSGSSRESRSAPEESRTIKNNDSFVPSTDSMALLLGSNSKRPR